MTASKTTIKRDQGARRGVGERRGKKILSSKDTPRPGETKDKDSLPKIEPFPGAVCIQMVRCGRANCRCSRGDRHGPYSYRFFYQLGILRKEYVKKADATAVEAACLAFRQQRRHARAIQRQSMQQWRDLNALLRSIQG